VKKYGKPKQHVEARTRSCSSSVSRGAQRRAHGTRAERQGDLSHLSRREELLDYAVRIREANGIWGGLNEAERKQIVERGVAGPRAAASA